MDTTLYRSIGSRIRRKRESLNLSQDDIAQELGYKSAATVSHIESGNRKVTIADLQRLAVILNVSIAYLVGEEVPEPNDTIRQQLVFRARHALPKSRIEVKEFLTFAEKYGTEPNELPSGIKHGMFSYGDAEKAATAIIKQANITTLPISVRGVAKFLNIAVYDWELPDDISGLCVKTNQRVCIGVNQKHPRVRQRFTIAHELGHYVLHHASEVKDDLSVDIEGQSMDTGSFNDEDAKREREANFFASDLLMPEKWVRRDFKKAGSDYLAHLSRQYSVSQQAMWFRLLKLKLVT